MSMGWSAEMRRNSSQMSSYGKLYTLELCSHQLLASKNHSNFNLKKKIAKNNYSPPYFYLPTWENLHRLPYLVQNIFSD
jgi:hypothetical protein